MDGAVQRTGPETNAASCAGGNVLEDGVAVTVAIAEANRLERLLADARATGLLPKRM